MENLVKAIVSFFIKHKWISEAEREWTEYALHKK